MMSLSVIAVFMILIILVQKGKGGGLAGALGGPGGSSAFGAKSGDVFTVITAALALIWMTLCISASVYYANGKGAAVASEVQGLNKRPAVTSEDTGAGVSAPAEGADTGAAETPAAETPAPEAPAAE